MSLEKNPEPLSSNIDENNVENIMTSISTALEHNVQSNGEIIVTNQGIVWATGTYITIL